MFYYEIKVSGIAHDYTIGLQTDKECKSIKEIAQIANDKGLFDNEKDKDYILSYSKVKKESLIN